MNTEDKFPTDWERAYRVKPVPVKPRGLTAEQARIVQVQYRRATVGFYMPPRSTQNKDHRGWYKDLTTARSVAGRLNRQGGPLEPWLFFEAVQYPPYKKRWPGWVYIAPGLYRIGRVVVFEVLPDGTEKEVKKK